MIIEQWHYNFKLRINRIDSQDKKDLNPAEIDEILNDAIKIWVNQQYSGNNVKKESFEESQQKLDNLSTLSIKYPDQQPITPVVSNNLVSEFALSNLKYEYLHMLRCKGTIQGCFTPISVNLVQTDDLNFILSDPFRKPSNGTFKRLVGTIGKSSLNNNSSLYLYKDNFEIENVYIEYLKVPNIVSIGGYHDINGNIKSKVECDLPETFHTQIIDIAVQEYDRINNPQGFQLSSQKQLVNN